MMRKAIRLVVLLMVAILVVPVLLTMVAMLAVLAHAFLGHFPYMMEFNRSWSHVDPLGLYWLGYAGFILASLFFVLTVVVVLTRLIRRDTTRNRRDQDAEESRLIQELHQGFGRLEERVETLETILLERARAGS